MKKLSAIDSMSGYQTFSPSPKSNPSGCRERLGIIATCLYALFSIAFHTSSLILAFQFVNAECYESKELITLAQWLMASSFPNVIGWFVLICAFACLGKGIADHNGESILTGICVMMSMICGTIIYYMIITIFGIVELSAQYRGCAESVEVITSFVIAGIINNIMMMGICIVCIIKLNPQCSITHS